MNSQLYFWTFTFKEAHDLKVGALRWHRFMNDPDGLLKAFPNISGLRVFEMHPGTGVHKLSHGLHIHAVVNDFLPVDIVRSIWTRKAEGRIHVKLVPQAQAMYLGKYLSKDRQECFGGIRLWAAFGMASTHKVKDIVVDSRWTESYKFLAMVIGNFKTLNWNEKLMMVTKFSMGIDCEEALKQCGYYDHQAEQHRMLLQDEREEYIDADFQREEA